MIGDQLQLTIGNINHMNHNVTAVWQRRHEFHAFLENLLESVRDGLLVLMVLGVKMAEGT